jgi:hypothetical protein
MKRILTALGTAGLLALTACGGSGGGEAEANNTSAAPADDLALPPENGTDPLAGTGDTLENQAGALDANLSNGADLNATGNVSTDLNATDTSNTTNTQ